VFIRRKLMFCVVTTAAVAAVLCCGCSDTGIGGAFGEQRYGVNNCGTDGTAGSCKTVTIGEQTWMAENLNRTPSSGNSWCYDDKEYNCRRFGRLYDWYAAKSVCPTGWYLPSREEWQALVNYAGGDDVAGKKLKSTYGWYNDGNGTDEYGFSALPGGDRYSYGYFYDAGYYGHWWTATDYDGSNAYYRDMDYNYGNVYEGNDYDKSDGYSVRCVKD